MMDPAQTFDPRTNVYAAIAAGPTPEQRQAELAAARLARYRRGLSVLTLVESDDAPTKHRTPRVAPERVDADFRRVRDALVADYAAAFPLVRNLVEHGYLTNRLAERHSLTTKQTQNILHRWREAHGLHVPTYAHDGDALRPGEIALLQVLAAHDGPVPSLHLIAALGYTNGKAIAATVAPLRARLVALTGDTQARAVIVTVRGLPGYELNRTAAARYPLVLAALEDGTP